MKHIPKKYFSKGHLTEALLNIRRCLASGLTLEQMAGEITEKYRDSKIDDQASLGLLLSCVYDFSEIDTDTAIKCAKMFRSVLPLGMNPRRSISYEIYRKYCREGSGIPWLGRYRDKVVNWEGIEQYDNNPYFWKIIDAFQRDELMTLCKDAHLYCYVDQNLTVNLFVLENSVYDLIIQEVSTNPKKPPYYLTEFNYLESPVYKVKVAKRILEYCLKRIGYPKVEIKMQVFFSCFTSKLINLRDYTGKGKYAQQWEGVETYRFRDMAKCAFEFTETSVFDHSDDETDADMLSMLLSSLSATALMFSDLFYKDRLVEHTPGKLRNLAKRLEIFV